jgi:hypothetical protein
VPHRRGRVHLRQVGDAFGRNEALLLGLREHVCGLFELSDSQLQVPVLAELCAQLVLQPRQTDLALCQICLGTGNREKAADSDHNCQHDNETPG